eukprot:95551-Pyramimonas_sp.AAC.1
MPAGHIVLSNGGPQLLRLRGALLRLPESAPPAKVSLPIGSLANLSAEFGAGFAMQRARNDRELHWGTQRHPPTVKLHVKALPSMRTRSKQTPGRQEVILKRRPRAASDNEDLCRDAV